MSQVVYQSEHATITTERAKILDHDYLIDDIEEVDLYEGRESMIRAGRGFLGPWVLLMHAVLPTNFDSGLVVAKSDGKSDIIQGLQIAEARKIMQALGDVFKMKQPPTADDLPKATEELNRAPPSVEEGIYEGRKWRRLESG